MTTVQTTLSLRARAEARGAALLELSDDTRDALRNRLMTLTDPALNMDATLLTLYRASAELPDDVLGPIRDFGRYPDAPATMLVRNLPVDPSLPATPTDGKPSRDKTTFVSEGVLMALTQLIGEPAGYTTEKEGQLIHDIIAVESGQRSQTNQSSAVFLNFHNDITYDDSGYYNRTNPDFLLLVCLRESPDGRGRTAYADARVATRKLDHTVVEVLRRPAFQMNAPGTYCREHANGAEVWSKPVPVISGPAETPEIAASANGVKPLTDEAKAAWHALHETCQRDDVAFRTLLKPGDALLINNRKGLHAREPFEARFTGSDRWLQRTYVRRSLWDLRHRSTRERRVHF